LEGVEVRWSTKMTLCAGMCYCTINLIIPLYLQQIEMLLDFKGGYCSVRLSEPLLKFRPRSDFINTLLHEMIHAYLFVTARNTDRGLL
jgi:SprT-like domain-contaning protein Spartan